MVRYRRRIFLRICLLCEKLCFEKNIGHLCAGCYLKIKQSSSTRRKQVRKLAGENVFRYNNEVRQLVIKAKVAGDPRAIESLCGFICDHTPKKFQWHEVTAIMPAPSSAWSRIRGRSDLAWLFAKKLSELTGVKFYEPPYTLLWRFKKRSFLKRCNEVGIAVSDQDEYQGIQKILLIDDVITTGHTLGRLADVVLTQNYMALTGRCFYFVLADAR